MHLAQKPLVYLFLLLFSPRVVFYHALSIAIPSFKLHSQDSEPVPNI